MILVKKLHLLILTIYLNVNLKKDSNDLEEKMLGMAGYDVILMEELITQYKAVIFFMYYLTFAFEFQLSARVGILAVINSLCGGCFFFEEGLHDEF